MKKLLARIGLAFRVRLCHWIDNLVIFCIQAPSREKKMLLIRLDAIGDYVLFRNFLSLLSDDPTHKDYQKILCGNSIWKSLFEAWDNSYVDDVIWINRKQFYHNPWYRFQIQKQIRQAGFELVLEPTYSRLLLYGDAVAKVSGAKERIAQAGNLDNIIAKEKAIADQYYTKLIPNEEPFAFEFERNKHFFEQFLAKKLPIKRPYLQGTFTRKKKQISLFVGASETYKCWYWQNFAELILSKTDFDYVLLGGKNELKIAQQLLNYLQERGFSGNIRNEIGKTSLLELTQIIGESRLLLSNETVATHLGAITQTPTVCIANGRHIGRFSPYPVSYKLPISHVFPPLIEADLKTLEKEEVYAYYSDSMGEDIDTITIKNVLKTMEKVLQATTLPY